MNTVTMYILNASRLVNTQQPQTIVDPKSTYINHKCMVSAKSS